MDSKLSIRNGMPTGEFLSEAWRDETLNVGLPGIYAPVAFAPSDPAMSLVATMDGSLVGQCASHRVAEYWEHAMLHGERGPNDSTRCVRKIPQGWSHYKCDFCKTTRVPLPRQCTVTESPLFQE